MLCRVRSRKLRRGFTTIELVMALVILGAMTAIAVPRFTALRTQSNVRSAKAHVAAYLMATQAGAIRRGTTATFVTAGGRVWATMVENGASTTLLTTADIQDEYGVTLTSNRPFIQYDMRGVPKTLPATAIIWITAAGKRDSVCVSRAGMLMQRGCTL